MRATMRLILLVLVSVWAPAAFAGEVTVRVGHNRLDPASLTVGAGTTVVFHNVDEMPGGHTVAADDGSFQSPPLAIEQRWSHTFSRPGTFTYSIREHPGTKGTIAVVWE